MSPSGWWGAHRLLERGSRGRDVEALQRTLSVEVTALRRPPTGIFDEETENAVRTFQRKNFLIDDGKVGPITDSILFTGHYEYAISKPQRIQEEVWTCWAAALQSVLGSTWSRNRPRLTVSDLIDKYRRFLEPMNNITIPGWYQIGHDLRLRGQQLKAQDLRIERIVWLLRENQTHLVMVHDMTGAIRHTVVIYGVRIQAGSPNLLVMDPNYGDYRTIGADIIRLNAHQLFISMPGEVKILPPR